MNIDPSLSFNVHLNTIEARINSTSFKLNSVKRYVPELTMNIMFNAYTLSIYDYCIEVRWCVQCAAELNKIQFKIDRFLFSYLYPTMSKKLKKIPRSGTYRHLPVRLLTLCFNISLYISICFPLQSLLELLNCEIFSSRPIEFQNVISLSFGGVDIQPG